MLEYGMGEDSPKVSKIIVEYTQNGDCCEKEDDIQSLTLESMDNGTAPFIRMKIEGHWSISGYEDLRTIFDDFEEKLNYINE